MHEITEDDPNEITRPIEIFTHPGNLEPTDLSNNNTTPAGNHQYNGDLRQLGTQPSLPNPPQTDASVSMDNPPPHPYIEYGDATCLASMADHTKVLLKVAGNALFGVYHDWVHQSHTILEVYLDGIQAWKCNSEWVINFQLVILKCVQLVTGAKNIRSRIEF